MKVSIETLGCKVNQYESDAMIKLFEERGYEHTHGKADIYIINTCTVTNLSARKSRQFISKAKSENPEGLIAVVGCYSQTEPEAIKDLGVDVILGTQGRDKIVDLCEEALKSKEQIEYIEDLKIGKSFDDLSMDDNYDMTRAYLKIQEGCNQFCTYCIIPYARGPITSRDMESIIEEAKNLAENGYKEVVLTGIHVASYGYDLDTKYRLIDVIEKINEIPKIQRIRLSSIEPRIIDEEFLDRLSKLDKICDHFHLSLQAGSDKILKKMNRKYDRDTYLEKISLIRSYYPNAGLTTDIMVGFPEESENDFLDTLDMVKMINFSKVHVFRYSQRKGTPAASYKNQISGTVKKERSERLRNLADESEKIFLDKQIGKTLAVLFEEKDGSFNTGHSKNYLKVYVESQEYLEGQINDVIIVSRKNNFLIGKIC